jgi:transcriptional regulatory protein RtcR
VHITTGTHVAQICLFLLVQARLIPGLLLQTAPPRGRQGKGQASYELIDLDLSRYDAINARLNIAKNDAVSFLKSGIKTNNPRFNDLIDEIEQIAIRSPSPILLFGATGAGKSMLAKRIYQLKRARHLVSGVFVDVNCATLRGDGAASTLFGHKKGSFTGAVNERAGLLRTADKGVLFLDEIAQLGLDEQAMLLKAIEEKHFLPVGADQEVSSHFQLIAGTNQDLRVAVKQGLFREDLFARINLWSYTIPSLAQRREDIAPNIEFLLAKACEQLGKQTLFTTAAHHAYLHFALSTQAPWTGNFRDLSASITRLATLADNGRISIELVQAEIARLQWQWEDQATPTYNDQLKNLLGEQLSNMDKFDRMQLESVIAVCNQYQSISDAGRELFNHSRIERTVVNDADRLRKYLMKFGLAWTDVQSKIR